VDNGPMWKMTVLEDEALHAPAPIQGCKMHDRFWSWLGYPTY
jgi:hypothetical protein